MKEMQNDELTEKEWEFLRLLAALKPWGRDRISHATARYLDGDDHALDTAPSLKQKIDETLDPGG